MNIQILPHIFKKIGLFLFIAYPVGHALLGFFDPFQCNDVSGFHPFWTKALEIGALIGIIIFLLSKKKIKETILTT